ncbi:MAG TPA: glycosyltransferase family 87 protein [Rhizomicrobium sp.]|jgi:hypothetical protein|nr:glycosyltransferase family 87 protein [Rhizomicrobium sp.]
MANAIEPIAGDAGVSVDLAHLASLDGISGAVEPARTPAVIPLNVTTIVSMAACGLALAYWVYLGLMYRSHDWILDSHGRPLVTDFLVFWLAGKAALHGAAAAAYDPHIHHALEAATAGRQFSGQLPWRYSPLFFFIVAPLALLPYVPAFILWVGSAVAGLALTLSRIAASRAGVLLACSTPAVFINAICGQNGPLTAALIGGALVWLEEWPVASGVCLALLTYKPQFGILFPIVLVAGGYWRVLISAAIACAAGHLVSSFVFGFDTLPAFLHFLPITSNALLVHGANGFNKLQTVYGMVRWMGFGNAAGWLFQALVILSSAAAVLWLWKRDVPYGLKAAALASAILLATPHLFAYDFAVLMVAFAFLYRERAFDTLEVLAVVAANFCIGAFLFFPTPIGLVAIVIATGIIARRVWQALASNAKGVAHAL